ncbi:MAG: hypothetical protein PHP22_10435 [Oscillospiraceae bacterium]|nr:hypothetical protein [Oscillospiraceae bacterium]
MKKWGLFFLVSLFSFALIACAEESSTTASTTTEEQETDDFDYNSLVFPNYSAENPVRYLQEDERGYEYDGWQNFGLTGEIQTHPWPMMTYTYQMYSYFLRNDLQALYGDVALPENLADLPAWVSQIRQDGHRILWFSMGLDLSSAITLLDTEILTLTEGNQTFLRAEYEVTKGEVVQQWIVYFMGVEGTFSSYSIRVNELYEMVLSTTDLMVQSYRLKGQAVQ